MDKPEIDFVDPEPLTDLVVTELADFPASDAPAPPAFDEVAARARRSAALLRRISPVPVDEVKA